MCYSNGIGRGKHSSSTTAVVAKSKNKKYGFSSVLSLTSLFIVLFLLLCFKVSEEAAG